MVIFDYGDFLMIIDCLSVVGAFSLDYERIIYLKTFLASIGSYFMMLVII